ncbi:allophanate hydrolase [Ferrovibrio sp.]|uniref:allophanate hydrolase n=1 Tax=Ferrovibrio sp. TaxID=1917215 RepID=UPI0025C20C0F|nr:allophanate hydrolase [Ferrovibrio sp.]MBX3453812.1 allophanate hydrolase [Ferrovibrio sp.]
MSIASLDCQFLRDAYQSGSASPTTVIAAIYDRIAARGEDAVWISLVPREQALAMAAALEKHGPAGLPLYGIPFAIKDNIDLAGLPTTAACAEYAYSPAVSAKAVERLIAAGAIPIGKTNLDQFATGLVGVRSPYGVAVNPFNKDYVPGGSSSGSAVAVSAGLVSFALGTDTAGSGRVPAGFNNIVGLKPSIGLLPASGVVPACRSLDCISVFALTVADAMAVLEAARGPDAADAYSRSAPLGYRASQAALPAQFRFAVPKPLEFFGDAEAARVFAIAIERLQAMGGEMVEVDYAPFAEAQAMLYSPPGAAERTTALSDFLAAQPDAIHPVTRGILESGQKADAVALYRMQQRLRALKQQTDPLWQQVDVMLVPTSGTIYRVADILAEPLKLNANLGYYTNFVNYFDLAALAVPNAMRKDGLPSGITLIAPAFHEPVLAAFGAAFHAATGLPLGAGKTPQPARVADTTLAYPRAAVAVFGAHMSGQPLNPDLLALGGRLLGPCHTAPRYRLYRIGEGRTARPGLVQVSGNGVAVSGEIWDLPLAGFGSFVAGIPAPLGIGTVMLNDGSSVKGFLCEAAAVASAEDISSYGDWRAYRAVSA